MSITNADEVKQLVKQQLDSIEDEIVRDAIVALLVEPFREDRRWLDDLEPEICWVVAVDPANGISFIYSTEGFKPDVPWGMVGTSDLYMGMDSNWYSTLEDALYDSWATAQLKIWNVVKRNTPDEDRVIAHTLTFKEAYALSAKLHEAQGIQPKSWIYGVEPRIKKWW